MYEIIDRPVEILCNAGRFLLWAMRGWTLAVERGACPPLALGRGFASVGAHAMLPDFHIAMALLNQHGRTRLALAPMACCHIVEDEAILLGLWRDLALGRFDKARGTLALVVREDIVSPMSRAMTLASAKLMMAGFDLAQLQDHRIED